MKNKAIRCASALKPLFQVIIIAISIVLNLKRLLSILFSSLETDIAANVSKT